MVTLNMVQSRRVSVVDPVLLPHRFGDGGLATLTYSFLQASAKVAHIYGTTGAITIDGMDCPDRLTVTQHDGSPPQVHPPFFLTAAALQGAFSCKVARWHACRLQ